MIANNKPEREITLFNKEPEVQVGITSDRIINFELYGDFRCQAFQNRFNGPFTAELQGSNIIFKNDDEQFQTIDEIIFEPIDPASDSFLIRNVTIGINFHWERKEKAEIQRIIEIKKR